jgi:hypothetical protein
MSRLHLQDFVSGSSALLRLLGFATELLLSDVRNWGIISRRPCL